MVPEGAEATNGALRISGKTRQQQPAFAGAMFLPGKTQMAAANSSACGGISFAAKGNGETFKTMMFTQKRGFMPSTKTFVAGEKWHNIRSGSQTSTNVMAPMFGESGSAVSKLASFTFRLTKSN